MNKRASLGGTPLFSYLVNPGHLRVFKSKSLPDRLLGGRATEPKKSATFSDHAPEW
ncbi:hypothetical protein [Pelagibacterium halotolerans]|uniref:hypothetical protein n=1 Tax=Pelagibacterium halotolerans TaxID=531813 RepID=UPI0013050FC0|nr:hypothetical protein [Pelagibacterium halotolerans]QJR17035.1 hypothetical protein HKM20_00265 [Pelagibacterium halotolerans]